MVMKNTKRNTETNSLEKIWKKDVINAIYFYNTTDIAAENVMDKLQEMIKKAKNSDKNWEDVTINPSHYEGEGGEEYNGPKYGSIMISGWRLETDQEYKERLEGLVYYINRNIEAIKKHNIKKSEARIEEIKKILEEKKL